jgi:transcriptional regulator of arginine metabolism
MTKQERQQKILDLIRTENIGTQEELGELLSTADNGVTQSSVSRDLDELGIVKVNGYYAIPQKEANENLGLRTLEIAGENLVVGKCASGVASAVCVLIDRKKIDEIVGTIAGDDTIFIAVRNHRGQREVLKKVWEIFGK